MDDFRFYRRALGIAEIAQAMQGENATTSRFDLACSGPGGIPTIVATSAPTLPNPGFSLALQNCEPGHLGLLVLGLEATSWLSLPLPLDIFSALGVGNAGCMLHVSPFSSAISGVGPSSVNVPLPSGFAGVHLYAQWLVLGSQGATTTGLDINMQ